MILEYRETDIESPFVDREQRRIKLYRRALSHYRIDAKKAERMVCISFLPFLSGRDVVWYAEYSGPLRLWLSLVSKPLPAAN
jgi:hypothetical protein